MSGTNEINKGLENMTRDERIAKEEAVTPRTIEQRIKALESAKADDNAGIQSIWNAVNGLRSELDSLKATVNSLAKHEGGG